MRNNTHGRAGRVRRGIVLAGAAAWLSASLAFAADGAAPRALVHQPYLSASIISYPNATFDNNTGSFSGDTTARGIAIRLKEDWSIGVVFDADLMRLAAVWQGAAPLLKGVAFDGGHGESPKLAQPPLLQTPHAPGWADAQGSFKDPRPNSISPLEPPGPLPQSWAKYKGLYTHGERVVLSYTVGSANVLESFSLIEGDLPAIVRTIHIDRCERPMALMLADANPEIAHDGQKRKLGVADEGYEPNPGQPMKAATIEGDGRTARVGEAFIGIAHTPDGAKLALTERGDVVLHLPASATPVTFNIIIAGGKDTTLDKFTQIVQQGGATLVDLPSLTKGGPARWTQNIETKGEVEDASREKDDRAYVVDRITVPYNNPYEVRVRIGGFDFFSDPTRAAVCTWRGDVWIITGIDDTLANLKWKRYACGLHQPLGLKIVDDVIYTVGHDQITRLHDLNNDGEADFYENFNNDWELTTAFHAFCFDLHTDAQGNFIFAFGSPVRSGGGGFHRLTQHHGCILKVSRDGQTLTTYATGLRAPNGIGIHPQTGQITSGDNEGTWVPKCPLHFVAPGSFLGVMDTAHREVRDDEKPPRPLCWMPKDIDNSGGGQVWVASDKWGPLQGELLHMSYGTSSLYLVLKEQVDGVMQGGVVKIPLRFTSSAMRARFNERDGQLYVAGLKGWQSNAGKDGGLDRVRYTGTPVHLPRSLHATEKGIALGFTCKLDKELAEDVESYSVKTWNYQWTGGYGSKEVDQQDKTVTSATLLADGQSVFLAIPDMQPVMQMQIMLDLESVDGHEIVCDIHNTIHKLAGS